MRSIFEFALIAWVLISVVAVTVQLIRISRYKRAVRASSAAETQVATSEAPTINLSDRLASTQTADGAVESPNVMASAATVEHAASSSEAPNAPATAPARPASQAAPVRSEAAPTTPAPQAAPTAPITTAATNTPETQSSVDAAPPTRSVPEPRAEASTAPDVAAPTLADLLAGVRLPWNLLPTIDQAREPSNDRVALITSEGDPGDIGVDVADELERLGFRIAPRGDDTAVATRGDQKLGLQIIEDPLAAEINGTRRFPAATESSVALDIWIES